MEGDPVQITQEDLKSLMPDANSFFNLGGIWGVARAGEVWQGLKGRRLLMHASPSMVIFVGMDGPEAGKLYLQRGAAFHGDITTAPAIMGAQRALPMARLVEYEMQFIMGVVATTSGVGLVAVVGTDVLRFFVEHRQQLPMWRKVIAALLTSRAVLKKHAPTLWDAIVHKTLLFAWRGVEGVAVVAGGDIAGNVPQAIVSNPAIIGRGLGMIVGTIGAQVAKGRINAIGLSFSILSKIVAKTLSAMPGAIKATAQQYTAEGKELVEAIRSGGGHLSEEDAAKIIAELQAHGAEVKAAIDNLVATCRGN